MNIQIRKGEKKDLPGCASVWFTSLRNLKKAPDAVTNTVEDMHADGFGDKPCLHFHMQRWMENCWCGIILCKVFNMEREGLYLDDLLCLKKYRGKGKGGQNI